MVATLRYLPESSNFWLQSTLSLLVRELIGWIAQSSCRLSDRFRSDFILNLAVRSETAIKRQPSGRTNNGPVPCSGLQSLLWQADFRPIIGHGPSANMREIVRFCSFAPQRAVRSVPNNSLLRNLGLLIIEFPAACFYTSPLEKLCLR